MATIRLDQVNLVVNDVPASRAFYSRLGLDFGEPDPVWDAQHVSARHGDDRPRSISTSTARRSLPHGTRDPAALGPSSGSRSSRRDEVDALVAALAADGVPVQQQPYDAFWGARYAVVSDPDGHGVGIMSPVDPALRRNEPPPQ